MKKNTQKGFTLVELLVVIAILAILASVAVVGYTSFIKKADDAKIETEIDQVNNLLTNALIDPTVDYVKLADDVYAIKHNDGTIFAETHPASGKAADISGEIPAEITLSVVAGKLMYGDHEVKAGITCPDAHTRGTEDKVCDTCGVTIPKSE